MKKLISKILMIGLVVSLGSCKDDKNDPDLIIDYSPVIFDIYVQNSVGEDLLDPSVTGNILDSQMYIVLNDKTYDVTYGYPEGDYYPLSQPTRMYMPIWYGGFIAPYFFPYPDLPERGNHLFVGEFAGDHLGLITFELVLGDKKFNIGYDNKKINGLDVDRKFYLDGKEISSGSLTLTL